MSDLPKGWAETNLGEIASLRGEKLDPANAPDAPFIGLEDIEANTSRILKTGKGFDLKSSVARFSAGEVLYSRLRPYLNKVTVPDFDGIASAEILVLQATAAAESEFIRNRIMTREFLDFAALLDKGDRPRVSFQEIAQFPVALPPLPEQRRIVAKVDGLAARTARARKELDRIPTLIARYKQRLLALAFSGELTAGWRAANVAPRPVSGRMARDIRSKFSSADSKDFIPPYVVPASWRWLRLPEIGHLDRGKSRHRPRNDPKLFGGKYPFVQTGDVRAADRMLTKFTSTYSEFGIKQSRLWPIGTVCITIAANIAETAILGIEACFPDSVVGFLPDADRISGGYVEYFIRTMRSELETFAPATAQKNINLNVLSSVRVPVPPVKEQAEIVCRIESAFGWLDRVAADHAAAARLLPKLDASILAKAFRGELVPQDPNDEPAANLLERIRAEREAEGQKPKNGRGRRAKPPPILTTESGAVEITGSSKATRGTRKTGKDAMSKSRQDDDVKGKPYLADLLKSGRFSGAQSLYRAADLPIADFYKQLAWEIDKGHILDSPDELKAA